jgi:hypothetical protein
MDEAQTSQSQPDRQGPNILVSQWGQALEMMLISMPMIHLFTITDNQDDYNVYG